MSYAVQRLSALSRLVDRLRKSDPNKPAEKPVAKAGLEVTTDADPKHGVHVHKIAGQLVGHTVKAVADGTIAWTAVPQAGEIRGKFKNHDDAKQYLADQYGEGVKTAAMQEAMNAANAKPVKKDDSGDLAQLIAKAELVQQTCAPLTKILG